MRQPIRSVGEFYAHALAMEREAADRYSEFEAYFADRGEDTLAGLCGSLARMERAHLAQLQAAAAHVTLPVIPTDTHRWLESGSPEATAREFFYRAAEPQHLLEIALRAEYRALDFFNWVGRTCDDESVCVLAREMAAEELQHVTWVRNALEYRFTTRADWESLSPGA